MPFGLRKHREITLKCHTYFKQRRFNPSKILPRVNFQSLQLRLDAEALIAATDAGARAVGVRSKIPLPSITHKIANVDRRSGVVELRRTVGVDGAKEIAAAMGEYRDLKEVRFFGKSEMGIEGAYSIAHALRYNTHLVKLDLTYAALGDDAAATIARCLRTNHFLKVLTLFDNLITDTGAARLAELLKYNQSLQQLMLGANRIGDAGAKFLADALLENGTLTILKLDFNRLTDAGVTHLARALTVNGARAELDLLAACLSDSAHEFAEVGALLELNVSSNRFSDYGAIALANMLFHNCRLEVRMG
jgi:hypothetical protein